MQQLTKKHLSVFIGAMISFATLAIILCLPHLSYAATGTLGTESPYVYCTYKDADGKVVDGNNLEAGTYEISFNISGMSSAAVIQVTASYTDTLTLDGTSVSQLSDTDTNFSSMGYLASEGNIVFGYVSNEDGTSAISTDGTALFTISATFSQACDAESVIQVATDPNLTFAIADYGDGYNDEYALVDSFDGYTGNLYLMTCDVTPSLGCDITGQIMIATDITGTETTAGIVGINVAVQKDGATVAEAVTDENGNYTLSAVPAGEYTMIISGESTVDREVTLIVTASKAVDPVGVVICDYNKDLSFNSADSLTYAQAMITYNVYADFTADGSVNSSDTMIYSKFLGNTVSYADVTLQ